MKTLMLAAIAGRALTTALPVLAADQPAKPAAAGQSLYRLTCNGLKAEFDKAEPYGRMESKLPAAEYLRGLGGTLCQEGRYADGIATLRNALAVIHIHPLTEPDPLEDRAG